MQNGNSGGSGAGRPRIQTLLLGLVTITAGLVLAALFDHWVAYLLAAAWVALALTRVEWILDKRRELQS